MKSIPVPWSDPVELARTAASPNGEGRVWVAMPIIAERPAYICMDPNETSLNKKVLFRTFGIRLALCPDIKFPKFKNNQFKIDSMPCFA
jgi:hypothetical protein